MAENLDSYLGPLLLCSASAKGDLETVKQLVEVKSVNANDGDYDGRTPLHLASEEGHLEVVQYLISKGANVNASDRWGGTPLRGAISYSRRDIATLLKDSGASFKFSDPSHISSPQNAEAVVAQEERNEELLDLFHAITGVEKTRERGGKLAPISVKKISKYLSELYGLTPKKNQELIDQLKSVTDPSDNVTVDSFLAMMNGPDTLLQRALNNRLVVPNWASFAREVEEVFESVRRDVKTSEGHNADYIPELADVDPELFGLCIVTVDGQVLKLGNYDVSFSIQSCHKPITYSFCAEILGAEQIHKYVGQEPSGVAFNAFTLNKNKKPHNPLINSGAIMVSAMYKPELNLSKRFRSLTESMSQLAGGEKIGFSQSVYLSEKNCAHRNFALAHFMAAEGAFPDNVGDILEAVDFYFQACSCEVDAHSLANIAATYANNGRNPISGKRCLSFPTVRNTLQLMNSCGMYDFSGAWACSIGLPAKSGVAGSIFVVIPDVLGLCVYSPPLDPQGNSTRGVEFCSRFARKFNWSLLDVLFSKQYDNRQPR